MYYIARLNDVGEWEYLDNCPTYSDAEDVYDLYCEMYPHTLVEIIAAD